MTLQVEFQAVVLAAGKGSRMPEITSGKPKCLLPVGPKPLIWYPLYKLQISGFTECIVIVLENQKLEIQGAIEKCCLKIKIEYQAIPGNEDLGTADSLRLIHDKLHSNVLVIPCDLVTDVNMKDVVDIFRKHNASIASLFLQPQNYGNLTIPGPKLKHKPASASDFENEVSLPKSLLKKHSNIKIFSMLVDSHVYIIRNWVIKYLKSKENISTLKGEFLPHIIRKQLSKLPKIGEINPSILNNEQNDDIFSFSKEGDLDLLIRSISTFNDHVGDLKSTYHEDSIRCFACISEYGTFGVRVNTLPMYCLINEKIIENWNKIAPNEELLFNSSKAETKSTQVDNKCIVWEGAMLNERTSFKNSIIGPNVEVDRFSRVFNCILMKNVILKERVALENCIVSDNAVVDFGSQLKSCLVGSNHNVPEQSNFSNEVLIDSDHHRPSKVLLNNKKSDFFTFKSEEDLLKYITDKVSKNTNSVFAKSLEKISSMIKNSNTSKTPSDDGDDPNMTSSDI
ncbi:hypothetical protein HHI36_008056 [Cryptolaemus montrouzieri]|uniref:Translation initiation factor eIF2B subunit gamma n=1 Tax=Cryptolaemus montrouzieri TaxID=559131 RepID=A0ABD2MRX1_9CUCU